jgi:hypothetical protein
MEILNHVFFLHPMNIWWDKFFLNVSLIELNAWEDEWFVIEYSQNGKRKAKKLLKKNKNNKWYICGQCIDACKLGVN